MFVGGEFAGMVPPTTTAPSGRRVKPDAAPITARPYLAALDATTGALLDWDVHPDDAVLALAVSADRRTLYVGGRFDTDRRRPASPGSPPSTSRPAPSKAELQGPGHRRTRSGPDGAGGNTLYIGGEFTQVGDAARAQVAALDATTGALRAGFVPPSNGGGRYTGPNRQGDP